MKRSFCLAVMLMAACFPARAQHGASASNMTLLGAHDLQGRSAYQPLVKANGNRWIAYVGHHGGKAIDRANTGLHILQFN